MATIGILYVGIGRYIKLWEDFHRTCEQHFCTSCQKSYFVVTDSPLAPQAGVTIIPQDDLGWPGNVVFRYLFFLRVKEQLARFDYLFFFNGNTRFLHPVTEAEFLPTHAEGGLIGLTWHHLGENPDEFGFERRPASAACIPLGTNALYLQSGITGGETEAYLQLLAACHELTMQDFLAGIIPVSQDESIYNKYMLSRPYRLLDSTYGRPSQRDKRHTAKIIFLRKEEVLGRNWLRRYKGRAHTDTWLRKLLRKILALAKTGGNVKRDVSRRAMAVCLLATGLLSCADKDVTYEALQERETRLTVEEVATGLPRVTIDIPGGQEVAEKSRWLQDVALTIYEADGTVNYQGYIQLKGRGNLSWGFPKKPYALKLPKRRPILGMPRHKRWCLLANWMDRTLMRNAVAFEIAAQMPSLAYTPRGRFVELFVNGTHRGNYYLTEQIKVDENRLDITEMPEGATEWPATTGGYLFELDDHMDEAFCFWSERGQLPWMLKDPDEVTTEQYAYVRDYVSDLEDALYDDARFARRDFARLMDLDTFAEWWLVMELTLCSEPRYPRSCYLHKDQDTPEGKALLKAGPVWDFDSETFAPAHTHQFAAMQSLYYPRLFLDGGFRQTVKTRWEAVKSRGLREHIVGFIDATGQQLRASDALNAPLWPVTSPLNADYLLSHEAATAQLRTAFLEKFTWLDHAIDNL